MTKRRRFCPLLLSVLILFGSCEGKAQPSAVPLNIESTTDPVKAERLYTEDDLAKLVLTVDREEISFGTGEIITLSAEGYAEDGTLIPDLTPTYYADGKPLEYPYFCASDKGYYNLFAKCGGIRSNVIEVRVRSLQAQTDVSAIEEGAFDGYSSSLPVIILDTDGKAINPYRPRPCTVSVYGSPSEGAKFGDLPTLVTKAEIKQRGQSSMGFEKKQYSLHTVNEDGSNNNVKLLGLPKENDWVLNGSYADKSLIRNALAQRMLSKVMDYTSRTQYCEVYLRKDDGGLNYLGVYTLLETIKIDGKRLNIDKLTENDNAEPEITGGYVFSLDKVKGGENTLETKVGTLTVVKPGPDTITQKQDRYIKNYLIEFTDMIKSDQRNDPMKGVTAYVDIESFAGPLMITELLRNVDGFAISTYMYKERDGLIHYGPGWDYDLCLGNADYNDGRKAHDWYVVKNSSLIRNLMRADAFSTCVVKTWKELRKETLSDENLDRYLDEQLALIGGDCITRSCARWPNHWNGAYVWPNYNHGEYFTPTHAAEIEMMRTFLHERAKWMDQHIDELLDYPY